MHICCAVACLRPPCVRIVLIVCTGSLRRRDVHAVRYSCVLYFAVLALRQYFRAQFILTVDELKRKARLFI